VISFSRNATKCFIDDLNSSSVIVTRDTAHTSVISTPVNACTAGGIVPAKRATSDVVRLSPPMITISFVFANGADTSAAICNVNETLCVVVYIERTFGNASNTCAVIAASPYILYAAAFMRICSACALPTAATTCASAPPIIRVASACARASSIVFVL
jgi:hypothetical protein